MLKLAGIEDLPEVHRMAKAFHLLSPYKDMEINDDDVTTCILPFLTGDKNKQIIILAVEERPVGLVAGLASKMLFNDKTLAAEVMWWVDPEHRKSRVGKELKEAYEFWAKKIGCSLIQMTLLETEQSDRIEKLYTRKGYKRLERAYLKEV